MDRTFEYLYEYLNCHQSQSLNQPSRSILLYIECTLNTGGEIEKQQQQNMIITYSRRSKQKRENYILETPKELDLVIDPSIHESKMNSCNSESYKSTELSIALRK